MYDIIYGRANANATIFVFNWKVNIKEQRRLDFRRLPGPVSRTAAGNRAWEQRCLILFAFIESYAQNFPAAKMRYKGFAFSK